MANVTYLLGAGASANTIPIVNSMADRFIEIISYLTSIEQDLQRGAPYSSAYPAQLSDNADMIRPIINDINWLRGEASKHQTNDTLAKRFYLTNSPDLSKLKKTLITYFTIEQVLNIPSSHQQNQKFNKKPELRYDSFFAALLNKSSNGELEVNPSVKILTWNYDQQIELALKNYVPHKVQLLKQMYNIYPHEKSFNDTSQINIDKFGVIKLNGNAIWSNPTIDGSNIPISAYDGLSSSSEQYMLLSYILDEYKKITIRNDDQKLLHECLRYFNFSWESDRSFSNKYPTYYDHQTKALEIASSTEYLVIIGYSFPVFNREVDKQIIDGMRSIKKVYIQDPNAESIKSTLENGFNIFSNYSKRKYNETNQTNQILPVQLTTSTDQFLIPYELS